MKRIEWFRLLVPATADKPARYVGPTMRRETAQRRLDALLAKGFGAQLIYLFTTVDGRRV